jgi:hypothetical protein
MTAISHMFQLNSVHNNFDSGLGKIQTRPSPLPEERMPQEDG